MPPFIPDFLVIPLLVFSLFMFFIMIIGVYAFLTNVRELIKRKVLNDLKGQGKS
jgi:hypothetical protein